MTSSTTSNRDGKLARERFFCSLDRPFCKITQTQPTHINYHGKEHLPHNFSGHHSSYKQALHKKRTGVTFSLLLLFGSLTNQLEHQHTVSSLPTHCMDFLSKHLNHIPIQQMTLNTGSEQYTTRSFHSCAGTYHRYCPGKHDCSTCSSKKQQNAVH